MICTACRCLTPDPRVVCQLYRVVRRGAGDWIVLAAISQRTYRPVRPAAILATKAQAVKVRARLSAALGR